jgi:hypothetical protein
MSVPKNHHYVSQALSRNFLSEGGRLYKYDKSERRIKTVNSTKRLFSKDYLNSIINEDGEIDHISVETQLNRNFESEFPNHCELIFNALNKECEIGNVIPNSENIQTSMEYLLGMALIGPFRHPQHIHETEEIIFGTLMELADNAVAELQSSIYSELNRLAGVMNKVPVDFNDLRNGMLELMGDIKFGVMRAPEPHYFILPDCSAGTKRFQMPSDYIDGKEYINPSMPIGFALMPINSKVVITAVSRRILPDEFREQTSGFYTINEKTVFGYNNILYDSAYREVVCENKEYLESFIKKMN